MAVERVTVRGVRGSPAAEGPRLEELGLQLAGEHVATGPGQRRICGQVWRPPPTKPTEFGHFLVGTGEDGRRADGGRSFYTRVSQHDSGPAIVHALGGYVTEQMAPFDGLAVCSIPGVEPDPEIEASRLAS